MMPEKEAQGMDRFVRSTLFFLLNYSYIRHFKKKKTPQQLRSHLGLPLIKVESKHSHQLQVGM